MGRKAKHGLNYTFLPVDFFSDIKIQRLTKKAGNPVAPLVYQAFLCLVYKERYYIEWNSDLPFIVGQMVGIDEEEVERIFNLCLNLDLFSRKMFEENNIITSHGIQVFYNKACSEGKMADRVDEFSLMAAEMRENNFGGNTQKNTENGNNLGRNALINAENEDFLGGNDQKVAKKDDNLGRNATNRIEENRIEKKYYSSFSKSFSSLPESATEKEEFEKQKQEIDFIEIFFFKNWQEPVREFRERFIPWNNSGKRCWAKMTKEQREAAVIQWIPRDNRPRRFPEGFLKLWRKVVDLAKQQNCISFKEILSDSIACEDTNTAFGLTCSLLVRQFIERNLTELKPLFINYLGVDGINKQLFYRDTETNDNN